MPYSFPRASHLLSHTSHPIFSIVNILGKESVKKVLWIKAMITVKKPEFCQGAARVECFVQKGQPGTKHGIKAGRGTGGGGSLTAPEQGEQDRHIDDNLVQQKLGSHQASL